MGGWDGRDYARITINPELPCSVAGCGRLAAHAVVERDEAYPELWRLLPVCDTCARRLATRDYVSRPVSDPSLLTFRH